MQTKLGVLMMLAGTLTMSSCMSPQTSTLKLVRKPLPPAHKQPYEAKDAVEMPFFVLNNAIVPPVKNFVLSGFMGDVADLRIAGSYSNELVKGMPVLKIQFDGRGNSGWSGVLWMNPASSWGAFDGGYNLSNATSLTFWACGQRGGEIVSFTCGGTAANYPDSDSISTGAILLSDDWKQYIVDLTGSDLSYISSGFGLVVKQDMNPDGCTFFLDDIRFN